MRHHDYLMLPLRAFRPEGGRMRLYSSDSPPPPDYTPMAEASKESAAIMAELGNAQLDFTKQQYEEAKPLAEKLVNQQMAIADKTSAQGDDYYNYMKSFRPAERALLHESMGLTPDQVAELEAVTQSGDMESYNAKLSQYGVDANKRTEAEIAAAKVLDESDAKIIGGTDSDVLDARRGEIEAGVGRAVADSQGGYTRSLNQIARQGLRYGMAPGAIASQAGNVGMAQASQTASAANFAREQGIMGARTQAGTNMALRRDIADNVTKKESIGWAKKLDASGLVKGLPGASQGAYGLAVSAGNSAAGNQAAPGAQMQAGMAAGAGTIGAGRSLYQNGLGSILNSQTQIAMNDSGDDLGGIGAIMGGAAKLYSVLPSDSRLKEDIVQVGFTAHGLPLYEFKYIADGIGDRYRGVMAAEVEQLMPDAVVYDSEGFASVNYGMLGIEMEKV